MQAPDETLAGADTRGLPGWISGPDGQDLQQRIHTKKERMMTVTRTMKAHFMEQRTRKLRGIAAILGAASS